MPGRRDHQSKSQAAPETADTKKHQHHNHAQVAATNGKKSSRSAAAAELHADAEDEGAKGHGYADGRHGADHAMAEDLSLGPGSARIKASPPPA